ncbi:MAG TPA: hypothetical protein VLA19_00505 [Herpetosiphonaceae bacterium]|nr:hypothetical protein [Herpetosiphonaceae bacterium]
MIGIKNTAEGAAMIQMQFNRERGEWAVVKGDEVVQAGLTMFEANRLYAELVGATLVGRTRKRKVFR